MSNPKVRAAFDQQVVMLPVQSIVPQREVLPSYRKSQPYLQISASLEHVGLIESLVVFPKGPNEYLLLDGHVRLDILKRSGATEVSAIFATDDEAYTYNKRVNHAPPVAQHFMILKALKNGVSEERIATALNVDVGSIRKRRDMLDGICPEAIELLRNSHMTADSFAVLRKMKPIRQIEAAEYMLAGGTYTVIFAKALLEVTPPEFLVEVPKSRKLDAQSAGSRVMFEQETDFLIRDLKAVEDSYGTDILLLTVSCRYLQRLLENDRLERHLTKHHPDILNTLRGLLSEIGPERARAIAS
ncbi:MAG: plasmid partitioning protein RepB C-terminal domain-containing protein [Candidatus Sulfotelmatobacter sp.]